MRFLVSCFVYCAVNWSQSSNVYEESTTMTQFTPLKIWKLYAILHGIHFGSPDMKISRCLGVNMRTMQRIWKEMDEFNGCYENMLVEKSHFDRSDKKITPGFVCKIQSMIDNDHRKLIRSIAGDMGASELLIRQVVHEDGHYFSYRMIKYKFLSQVMMYHSGTKEILDLCCGFTMVTSWQTRNSVKHTLNIYLQRGCKQSPGEIKTV